MDPDFRFLGSQAVSLVWLFKGELQMSKELRYYFLNTFFRVNLDTQSQGSQEMDSRHANFVFVQPP